VIVNHPDDVWIYDLRNVVGTSIDGERLYGNQPNLLDAMREFPVEERREINRSKLGWPLKKNANRIVGGYELQQSEANGRTAWRVAKNG
jgi:hypothetical protein